MNIKEIEDLVKNYENLYYIDEDIDDYHFTFLLLIASKIKFFNEYRYTEEQMKNFINFYQLDNNSILKLITTSLKEENFEYTHLFFSKKNKKIKIERKYFEFFNCLIKYSVLMKKLEEIDIDGTIKSIDSNLGLYRQITEEMDYINNTIAFIQLRSENIYSDKFHLYNNKDFTKHPYVRSLFLLKELVKKESDTSINPKLKIIYRVLNYELKSQAKSIYFILVIFILNNTFFINKMMISELSSKMFDILRNSKIISIYVNYLYQDISKPYEKRGKKTDNTTRLEIVYALNNYDAYSLRFDLPHKGVGIIHFNNISPGGTKSLFFSEDEYKSIIGKNNSLKKFFLKTEDKYFLYEEKNIDLDKEEKKLYENIESIKMHEPIFKKTYSEDEFLYLIELLNKYLNPIRPWNVDKNGVNKEKSFNYNKLLFMIDEYFLSLEIYEINEKYDNLNLRRNFIKHEKLKKEIINFALKKYNLKLDEFHDFYELLFFIVDCSYEELINGYS